MIFLDINVLVDVLSAREGYEASAEIIESIKEGKEKGCISALTIPITWYVLGERRESIEEIRTLTKYFTIVPLSLRILNNAFESKMRDFEDSIQLNSALKGKSEFLITRNKKDFEHYNKIIILTPEEFLSKHGN
ncbi:MAG: PIN domain-containing protein [Candidatus Marsarchaeota archaeon]|jgi:predicted nucleic acid-binding protein|nr:PIN domain-containing protein [Candidatus Marsarchaeota archaeon]